MNIKEIEKAIHENRICIYMQPIYSIKKKTFTSAEILARLLDEEGNIIPPCEFIPKIEHTKLMFLLEIKILKIVCDTLIMPEIQNLDMEYIEINMSVKNAEKKRFLKEAQSIIDTSGIKHSHLNIEITETAVPFNEKVFFQNINFLRDKDFRISLDDFGIGNSNFQYLLNIPAKLIKLDMSLIQSAFYNKKSISIIHGITLIAHAIGSKTVAEGVEDEKTFSLLKDLDVDYIQGYYFSKPLPVEEFVHFMNEEKKHRK